jgi:type IV secretion system protein VirB4
VWFFDKGGSAKAATRAVGEAWYRLAAGGELALQPLRQIDDLGERAWATEWVLDLLEQEHVAVSPAVKDEVWQALTALASSPADYRSLTNLTQVLQSVELRQALQPYTLAGPFGSLLDGTRDPVEVQPWQCYELEALFEMPRVLPAVLSYLFHRTEMALDGAPTLIIVDEAGTSLDHPTFEKRIALWLTTLRKKNAAVLFATQSLGHVMKTDVEGKPTGIAATIIDCCPTRIFLANPHAQEPFVQALYMGMGLSERQCELLAHATPKKDYYFCSHQGQRLFQLELGPIALAVCGKSDPESLTRIDEVWREDPATFARRWLDHCGLANAARELAQIEEELCVSAQQ